MNPGVSSFPRRESFIDNPFANNAPFADGGYLSLSESARKGDVIATSSAGGVFPLPVGVLPPGGTALAVNGAIATAFASTSDVTSTDSDGLSAGEALLAYSKLTYGHSAGALILTNNTNFYDSCTLTNGNYVHCFSDGSASAVKFYIYTSSGSAVNNGSAATVTTSQDVACAALTSGDFVVVQSTSALVRHVIYNAGGTATTFALSTIESVNVITVSVAALSGGGYVVSYITTAGALKYVRYNNAGTIQGSLTTFVTGLTTITSTIMAVSPMSGGGFVIVFKNASSQPTFAIFNSSGTQVGSTTVVAAVTTVVAIDAAGTNDGGFCVAYFYNSINSFRFARYSSSGILQGSITEIETGIGADFRVQACPNGDLVFVWNTTVPLLRSAKYSALGGLLHGPTTVDNLLLGNGSISLTCFLDNRFSIAYSQSTTDIRQSINTFSGSASFGRFSPAGTLQGLATNVTSNPARRAAVAAMSNGGFVFAYISLSNTPTFSTFDSSGTVVVSGTVPEAVYTRAIGVAAVASGGFVIAWEDALTGLVRFARYSLAGVLQGAITTVESIATTAIAVAGSSGGNFAIMYLNASSHPRMAVFNASGTQVAAPATIVTDASVALDAAALQNGTFVFAHALSNQTKFSIYTAVGVLSKAVTTIDSPETVSSISVHGIPGSEFVVAYNNATTPNTKFARYSRTGVLQGSLTVIDTKASLSITASVMNNGDFWGVYASTVDSDIRFQRYISPCVILGAALRSGAPGATIPVQMVGYGTLRQDWGLLKTFNHTTSVPIVGNDGVVVGKTIQLTGI